MVAKLLIANRGEIACRIIETARRMGIKTVAVYSEADRSARHVMLADESVELGAAPSQASYLNLTRILAAIRQSGADSVHPGYGFLSERAEFAELLAQHNINFIGPPAQAIRLMGDKIESKRLAASAGVNLIPGHMEALTDAGEAKQIAADLGYPVMLKAAAGGGGKGMRIAFKPDELPEKLQAAASEAEHAFGDGRVFVEKYLVQPRHIEIQLLCDSNGHAVYLGERECSLQRRHQKVLEEAPSPSIDDATRREMGEQAVQLAKEVGYVSAGTVEFVVDAKGQFYFLEMNTRLQVEHRITEQIYGLDLVEWMIRIARGEALTLSQDAIKPSGWALEARIYAEDPTRGFVPSTGRLIYYRPPTAGLPTASLPTASPSDEWMERIRIDHGVDEGSEISMHYDPMIAKLISWGDDRKSAIEAMRHALNCYEIRGVGHNLHFLSNLVCHPDVLSGAIDTSWIERTFPDGLLAQHLQSAPLAPLVAVGALAWRSWQAQRQDVLEPPKHLYGLMTEVASTAKRQGFFVDVLEAGQVCVDGESVLIEPAPDGKAMLQGRVAMMLDGQREWFLLERSQGRVRISHDGRAIELLFMDARLEPYQALMPEKVEPDQSQFLMTPMPGILARMLVKEGELVQPGQAIAIVEAMKMENILRAKEQAVVDRILVSQGDSLETDQLLVEFARNA